MPPIPLRWDFLFHADHKTNPSMLGTLDSSWSQVSTRQIISISLGIQLIIGPLCHGNPRQLQKRIPECPKFLFIIILLVSIPNNSFLISNYCPFSFFPGFFYLLNFLPYFNLVFGNEVFIYKYS
jgi:hypothetical protein